MIRKAALLAVAAFLAAAVAAAETYSLKDLKRDRANNFYKRGETAVITGRLLKAGKPVTEGKLRVLITQGGKELSRTDLTCNGKPFRVTYKSEREGWVYFNFLVLDKAGKPVEKPAGAPIRNDKFLVGEIGVMFDPYQIQKLDLDHADGFYKCGEKVVVTGQLLKADKPVTEGKLRVLVKWENKQLSQTDLPCDGKPFRITFDKGEKPGWVYFGFQVLDKEGKLIEQPAGRLIQGTFKKYHVAEIGAMFEPENIRSSYPIPEDFMEFWKAERAKLAAVSLNAKVDKVNRKIPGIDLFKVVVDAGVDHPVTAYMAIPTKAKPKSLPIYITYQSHSNSGISPDTAIALAKRGAIGMIATWHGLPLAMGAEYYKKECRQFDQALRVNDREKWVFHGMYLRVLRALDYLKTRPEWNGRDLIVEGGSLGGCEAACAAALDPQVTMAIISVCGFCDYNGDLDGRRGSTVSNRPAAKKDDARRALSYHDAVSFARFIKCETYFCTGFADEQCPPSSVYAAYNNLPTETKKAMFVNLRTGHYGTTRDIKAGKRVKEFFSHVVVQPVAK